MISKKKTIEKIGVTRCFLYLIALSTFIFTSCNPRIDKSQRGKQARHEKSIFFPPKPGKARFQFLTYISSSFDIEPGQKKFNRFIVGAKSGKGFSKLYGITVRKGKVYAVDAGAAQITIIDFDNKTFEYFKPEGAGKMEKPLTCYVDSSNFIYVADAVRGQIIIYDENFKYVKAFGDPKLNRPTGVWVHDEKIWVADSKTEKLEVYENKEPYNHLKSIPDVEKEDEGGLGIGSHVNISDGIIYITDMGDRSVKKYELTGDYIGKVGQLGEFTGGFVRPRGIAVDKEKILFVADAAFSNIQLFNDTGQVLLVLGRPVPTLNAGVGGLWLPACIAVDYENLAYYQQYVDPKYDLKYLVFVTNQYGPEKISIYGRIVPKMESSSDKSLNQEDEKTPDETDKKK